MERKDQPVTVLLIEESAGDARLVREMLSGASGVSFILDHVDGVSKGLARLKKGDVDVVLSGVHLRDQQGVTAIRAIRSEFPGVPIVALTGAGDEGSGVEAVRNGAQDYLFKNKLDRQPWVRTIQYAVERHRLQKAKDDFLHRVSHELRTPMVVMQEGISQVMEGMHGEINERQRQLLSLTLASVERLARILDDLLYLSKLEAGKVELTRERLDLRDLVRQAAALFDRPMREAGLRLKVNLPAGPLEVAADADKISQVINNLVENALKFTERGGIEISARGVGDSVECVVADTGRGMAPEDMPRLFGRFEQLGTAPVRGEKGTGLGLTIAKALVELHGGVLRAESEPGQGTCLIFTVPVSQASF